jgi:hypothetical protein
MNPPPLIAGMAVGVDLTESLSSDTDLDDLRGRPRRHSLTVQAGDGLAGQSLATVP